MTNPNSEHTIVPVDPMQTNSKKFLRNHLEIAGFGNPGEGLYQTVRELYDNSLDAIYSVFPFEPGCITVSIVPAKEIDLGPYLTDSFLVMHS